MNTSCSMRRNCAASRLTPVTTAGSSSPSPSVTTSGPPLTCTRCHKHNRRCRTSRLAVSTGRQFWSTTGTPRHDPTMVIRRRGWPPSRARPGQGHQPRGGSFGQRRRDVRGHRRVRALETVKRPERPERRVVGQFGPEQGRLDAVVDPDVRPPPGVRRLAGLEGVLIRRGHDRRDVVDARVMRPRHLHPDTIADRHPVPVAGRAPPLLWRGSDPGVEVVLPRAALKDPVSHLSLPPRLSGGSRPAIVPHGESLPLVLTAEIFSLSGTGGGACQADPWTDSRSTPLIPDNDVDSKPRLIRLAPQSLTAGRTAGRDDSLAVGEGSEIGPQGDAAEAGYGRTAIR